MYSRDIFRRHFNTTYTAEQLTQLEQQKEAEAAASAAAAIPVRLNADLTVASTVPIASSRNMFTRFFYQKPCDSCYASKQANNQAAIDYKNKMTLFDTGVAAAAAPLPAPPKQMPFIVDVGK